MNYSGGSRGGALPPPPPFQSAVRKKTAVVHFTTIPFEPNTANYTLSHIWGGGGGGGRRAKFVPVIAKLPIPGLKFIKLFCALV